MSERPIGEDTGAVDYWADFWSHHIASDPDAVSTLLDQLDEEPELPDDLLTLFSAVLAVNSVKRSSGSSGSSSNWSSKVETASGSDAMWCDQKSAQ